MTNNSFIRVYETYEDNSIECARLRYAANEITWYLGLPAKVHTFCPGTDPDGGWTTVLVKYPNPSRWMQVLSPNEQITITQGSIMEVKETIEKVIVRLQADPRIPTDRTYEKGSVEYARLEQAAQTIAQRIGWPTKVDTCLFDGFMDDDCEYSGYRWTTVQFQDNDGWLNALSLEEQERVVLGSANEAAEAIQEAIDWIKADRGTFYSIPMDISYEKGSFEYTRLEQAAQTIAQRTGYPTKVLTGTEHCGDIFTTIWAKIPDNYPDNYTGDTSLLRWTQVLSPDDEQVSIAIVLGSEDEAAEAIEEISEQISEWADYCLDSIMQRNIENSMIYIPVRCDEIDEERRD